MRGAPPLAIITALAVVTSAPEPCISRAASAPHASCGPCLQAEQLVLEVRVFDGLEEVTRQTRLTIHRAGERRDALPHPTTHGDAGVQLQVPAGIYDLQAIHERDGRVLNIRWANRLVVMPYPDERGRHLEVINFRNGFGALQVRSDDGPPPQLAIYETGRRDKPAGPPFVTAGYVLFVVPAGKYDLEVRQGPKVTWMTGIEIPLDRTRLSIVKPQ
jgi:hypothetical protein